MSAPRMQLVPFEFPAEYLVQPVKLCGDKLCFSGDHYRFIVYRGIVDVNYKRDIVILFQVLVFFVAISNGNKKAIFVKNV